MQLLEVDLRDYSTSSPDALVVNRVAWLKQKTLQYLRSSLKELQRQDNWQELIAVSLTILGEGLDSLLQVL